MVTLHPDVAVVLGNTSLWVKEGQADAALGTQSSIIAATMFDGLPVELVTQPEEISTISNKNLSLSFKATLCSIFTLKYVLKINNRALKLVYIKVVKVNNNNKQANNTTGAQKKEILIFT